MGAKRASESGRVGVAGVGVDVAPIVGASGREDAWGFGLSSTFDKAGLGSSLGAGDGRTTGLIGRGETKVSGFPSQVRSVSGQAVSVADSTGC